MSENNPLPPEYDAFFAELADAPEDVRTMWRYAIALLMIDDEKARIIETREGGDSLVLTIQTVAGDRFEVVRPDISNELEQQLLEELREIVEDKGTGDLSNLG